MVAARWVNDGYYVRIMTISIYIEDEHTMAELGRQLAELCPAQCVIYLFGELGAGKTTLVRSFLRALGHEGAVRSPTYMLVEPYEINGRNFYHLDLYRLSDPGELEYLGLRDWLETAVVLLIEWPQRGEGLLPKADIRLSIDYAEQGRDVELVADSPEGVKIVTAIADLWQKSG